MVNAKGKRGEPVSRILFPALPRFDDHSSGPAVADALKLPTRVSRAETTLRGGIPERTDPARDPYLALLPVGLAVPSLLPGPRWALTPPFHPYFGGPKRFVFCGAFPRVTPAGRYPAPLSLSLIHISEPTRLC